MSNEIKGLLIKDLMLLKNQRQFFGIAVFIFLAMLFFYDNMQFCIAYVTMMFAFFTLSTMSYDEHDNGMGYLFSLPVTRRAYVREKYVLCFILSFASCMGISILSYIIGLVKKTIESSMEFWLYSIVIVLMACVLLAIQFPLQAKFGIEKSRIMLVATVGIISAGIYFGMELVDFTILNMINNQSIAIIVAVLLAAAVIIVCISYKITVRIVEKKEF